MSDTLDRIPPNVTRAWLRENDHGDLLPQIDTYARSLGYPVPLADEWVADILGCLNPRYSPDWGEFPSDTM